MQQRKRHSHFSRLSLSSGLSDARKDQGTGEDRGKGRSAAKPAAPKARAARPAAGKQSSPTVAFENFDFEQRRTSLAVDSDGSVSLAPRRDFSPGGQQSPAEPVGDAEPAKPAVATPKLDIVPRLPGAGSPASGSPASGSQVRPITPMPLAPAALLRKETRKPAAPGKVRRRPVAAAAGGFDPAPDRERLAKSSAPIVMPSASGPSVPMAPGQGPPVPMPKGAADEASASPPPDPVEVQPKRRWVRLRSGVASLGSGLGALRSGLGALWRGYSALCLGIEDQATRALGGVARAVLALLTNLFGKILPRLLAALVSSMLAAARELSGLAAMLFSGLFWSIKAAGQALVVAGRWLSAMAAQALRTAVETSRSLIPKGVAALAATGSGLGRIVSGAGSASLSLLGYCRSALGHARAAALPKAGAKSDADIVTADVATAKADVAGNKDVSSSRFGALKVALNAAPKAAMTMASTAKTLWQPVQAGLGSVMRRPAMALAGGGGLALLLLGGWVSTSLLTPSMITSSGGTSSRGISPVVTSSGVTLPIPPRPAAPATPRSAAPAPPRPAVAAPPRPAADNQSAPRSLGGDEQQPGGGPASGASAAEAALSNLVLATGASPSLETVAKPEPRPDGPREGPDLLAKLATIPNLETFTSAARAVGLESFVQPGRAYTIFAPNDEAFDQLGRDELDGLLASPDQERLRALLSTHIVEERLAFKDFAGKVEAYTSLGDRTITVSAKDVVDVSGASMVEADLVATNGIIHVIDKVLP